MARVMHESVFVPGTERRVAGKEKAYDVTSLTRQRMCFSA
jgi:hypothetical protein